MMDNGEWQKACKVQRASLARIAELLDFALESTEDDDILLNAVAEARELAKDQQP
jgi:hypothetical protein